MKKTTDDPVQLFNVRARYANHTWQGIMPDTGAAKYSTGGLEQYKALCKVDSTVSEIDTLWAGEARVGFGPGKQISSIGTVTVHTVLGSLVFHILEQPTPFLLCLEDMKRMQLVMDTAADVLMQGDKRIPLLPKWGHLWFHLEGPEAATAFLSEAQLRTLYRRFNHPAADRLARVLTRAGHADVDRSVLETISKFCHHCQKHSQAPRRFKFSLKDDHDFNYEIFVDVMHLDGQNVLHVVDSGTAFHGAQFLKEVSAKGT